MDITIIVLAVAFVINVYIIYKVIQNHMTVNRLGRSLKSSQHHEWLYSMGLYETAIKFNEWGQLMERQTKQHGYGFQIPNIKWYV